MNGRAVRDSHHINEDVLYATYHAAVEAMIEDAGALLEVIQTETEMEMQPGNKAAMDEVEQQIIELQERVLDLHKQKRAMAISDAYYNAQVNDYSQQLAALEDRQRALQTAEALRHGEDVAGRLPAAHAGWRRYRRQGRQHHEDAGRGHHRVGRPHRGALQVRSHDRTEICSIIKALGSRN